MGFQHRPLGFDETGDVSTSDKTSVLDYQEATNVPHTTLTTILTLAPGTDKQVTQINCSGMEYGKYQLFYNSTLKMTKRGGPDRDVVFDFGSAPFTVSSGDTLDVKVTHFVESETPTFECSVIGF